MAISKSTDSSSVCYLLNVRALTPLVCPSSCFLSIPAYHYGSFYHLLWKGKSKIHILDCCSFVSLFPFLAGVTSAPEFKPLWDCSSTKTSPSRRMTMLLFQINCFGGRSCYWSRSHYLSIVDVLCRRHECRGLVSSTSAGWGAPTALWHGRDFALGA